MSHVHHHVHYHYPDGDGERDPLPAQLVALLTSLITHCEDIMTNVTDLQAQADKTLAAIARETTIDQAIVTLVQANTAQIADLKAQLAAAIASNDPTALQGVLDKMTAMETTATANAQAVSDAVVANTPADPNGAAPASPVVPGDAPAGSQNTGTGTGSGT